jgi:hypothetical protein
VNNKPIFVFGSNEAGIHGAGAAKTAYQKHGARWNMGYGHYGDSFAIPTKDCHIKTLPLERVRDYVTGFLAYARGNLDRQFQVTRIGCGLAGYHDVDIAQLFKHAPENCHFDDLWKPYLPDQMNFWGTFA